ncbi:MAG: hypothetical protein KAR38_01890, partial [Calditrichia bacterium]|nr:hypothetical protein [Calditrichia bacterium]
KKDIDEIILKNNPESVKSFSAHFKKNTNISVAAYESRHLKYIKNKYKWFFIFNLENLLFIFALVVLFGAYYHIKYRNKKILESWEEQESEDIE